MVTSIGNDIIARVPSRPMLETAYSQLAEALQLPSREFL